MVYLVSCEQKKTVKEGGTHLANIAHDLARLFVGVRLVQPNVLGRPCLVRLVVRTTGEKLHHLACDAVRLGGLGLCLAVRAHVGNAVEFVSRLEARHLLRIVRLVLRMVLR